MHLRSVVPKFFGFLVADVAVLINAAAFAWLIRRLRPVDFGCYSLCQSVASFLTPLVIMGMPLTATHWIAQRSHAIRPIVKSILLLRLSIALAIAVATLGIASFLTDRTLAATLLAFIPVYVLNALQLEFVCVAVGLPWILSKSRVLLAGVSLVSLVSWVRNTTPVWMIPLLSCLGLLAAIAYQYTAIFRSHKLGPPAPGPNPVSAVSLVRSGFATTAGLFVQAGCYNSDVLLLGFFFSADLSSVGEYRAASKLMQLAVVPLTALLYTLGPQYCRERSSPSGTGVRAAGRTFWRGALLMAGAGSIALAFPGPALLERLAGRPLPVARATLHILAFAFLMIGIQSPYSAVLPYLGGGGLYFAVNGFAFVATILFQVALIPHYGIRGAAFGCLLGVSSALMSGCRAYHTVLARLQPVAGPPAAMCVRLPEGQQP